MRNYMSRGWLAFGTCVVMAMLGGPSCAAGEVEDVGELQQEQLSLLCATNSNCNDSDPCTLDLCVAGICIHTAILNLTCCPGCPGVGGEGGEGGEGGGGVGGTDGVGGDEGVGGDDGRGGDDGGQSGSAGSSTGGTGSGAAGESGDGGTSMNEAGNGGDSGASGGTGAVTNGEGGAAASGTAAAGGESAEAGAKGDGVGNSGNKGNAWRMEGGGCTVAPQPRDSAANAWLLGMVGALLLGRGAARRREARAKGTPGS